MNLPSSGVQQSDFASDCTKLTINWIIAQPTQTVDYRIGASWDYRQALIAEIAQVDAYEMAQRYSNGPLLILAFLALFVLSYEVTQSVEIASLSLLFTLAIELLDAGNISYLRAIHHVVDNRFFLQTIYSDHTASTYIFVPPTLMLTLYLLDRFEAQGSRWRLLLPWAAVLLALSASAFTHPVPFGLYVIIVGMYLVVRWLSNPKLSHLIIFFVVGAIVLIVAWAPLRVIFIRAGGEDLLDWESVEFDYAQNMLLIVTEEKAYILNPAHLAPPLVFAGTMMGLLMVLGARKDRTARYIFAATIGPMILAFTPYLTAIVGKIISPLLLERLIWLMPTGLALAYGCWLAIKWLSDQLTARVYPALMVVLLVFASGLVWPGYRAAESEIISRKYPCYYPYTHPTPEMEDVIRLVEEQPKEKASFVMAPTLMRFYLMGRVADVAENHLKNRRLGVLNEQFFATPWGGQDLTEKLRAIPVSMVVVEIDSEAHTFLRIQPDFFSLIYENATYAVYQVIDELWPLAPTEAIETLAAYLGKEADVLSIQAAGFAPNETLDWERVIVEYTQAIEKYPDNPRVRYRMAWSFSQVEAWAEAEALYRDLTADFPQDSNIHIKLAETIYQQGRVDEAISVLWDAPGRVARQTLLQAPYLAMLNEEQLDALLTSESNMLAPREQCWLAQNLASLPKFAIRTLEQMPPPVRDWQTLGFLYFTDNRPNEALEAFAASGTPNSWNFYQMTRGHIAMAADDYEAARDAYQIAASSLKSFPAPWIYLGRAYEASGDFDNAEQAYLAATMTAGIDESFWIRRDTGRTRHVQTLTFPGDSEQTVWAQAELLRFYTEQGDTALAQTAYERARDLLYTVGIPIFSIETPPRILNPLDLVGRLHYRTVLRYLRERDVETDGKRQPLVQEMFE